ncbi:MAG: aldose 1-epimerase family protein [Selenomonadaceae bacterium]
MLITIENEKMIAVINTKGAEIMSLKNKVNKIEYIWQADPACWGSHAPVLFPFIGQSKNKKYTYEGKTYPMVNHGLARHHDFYVKQQKNDLVALAFDDDKETRKVYPFNFFFCVQYILKENALVVQYKVENKAADMPMYYSIGAHPGFNVPFIEGVDGDNYELRFTNGGMRRLYRLQDTVDFLIDSAKTEEVSLEKAIELKSEMFSNGLIAYECDDTMCCTLASKKTQHSISVTWANMNHLCLWSQGQPLSFVCIEPWCGLPDRVDATGEITEKYGIQKLAAKQSKTYGMKIETR